jgi:hypothetical protein
MTKTISQKLREHALSGDHLFRAQSDVASVLFDFRDIVRGEWLLDLNLEEYFDFCNLVACALESEQ